MIYTPTLCKGRCGEEGRWVDPVKKMTKKAPEKGGKTQGAEVNKEGYGRILICSLGHPVYICKIDLINLQRLVKDGSRRKTLNMSHLLDKR